MNVTYCGRPFTPAEVERIRELTADAPHRQAVARAVCTEFGWFKPDGGLKVMSCKVALLKMERDGLITLPPPLHPYRQLGHRRTSALTPGLRAPGWLPPPSGPPARSRTRQKRGDAGVPVGP